MGIDNTTACAPVERLRIIVLGYIVRGPVGGMAWCDLHYLMGLLSLGHDVYYVEDSGDSIWCCYDPSRNTTDADPTYGLGFAKSIFAEVGLTDRWAYYDAHRACWCGPCASKIFEICATADLVLNLAGVNPLRSWFMQIPSRALVDKDPAFTQIRHIADPAEKDLASRHTAFFTFGENVAWSPLNDSSGRTGVATDTTPNLPRGLACVSWSSAWKLYDRDAWDSYRAVEHDGVRYG